MISLFRLSFLVSVVLSAGEARAAANTLMRKASEPSLYLCDGAALEGSCVYYSASIGECNIIADKFPATKNGVGSAVAGQDNSCTLFSEDTCTGDDINIDAVGHGDLGSLGWSSKARSYKCAGN